MAARYQCDCTVARLYSRMVAQLRSCEIDGTIRAVPAPHGSDVHARLRDESQEDHHGRPGSKDWHQRINDQEVAPQPVFDDRRSQSREDLHCAGLTARRFASHRARQPSMNAGAHRLLSLRDLVTARPRGCTNVQSRPNVARLIYSNSFYSVRSNAM